MNLKAKLEECFDPSSSDGAMQLAYAALNLLESCESVLDSHVANMRIGRDLASELSSRQIVVARALRLLDSHYDAADVAALRQQLSRLRPAMEE